MSLNLYVDLMSQPSRSLIILLKKVNYNFGTKLVDLRKGQHYSDEYTKNINRFQKVPVMEHNGFILTESIAILNYMSRENIIPENLYPKENKARARVQEFLEWHHAGLRLHCAMYFRAIFIDPLLGREITPKQLDGYKSRMLTSLEDFNTKWLGRGHQFVVGDKITVADLFAACELEQPKMAGYDPCTDFKNISVWMKEVKDYFNPHYDEGHVIVNKIIKKTEQTKLNAKL